MNQQNKFKLVIFTLLKYIKLFFGSIFRFFTRLFSINKKPKSILFYEEEKKNIIKKEKKITNISDYHEEAPINKDINSPFSISLKDLKYIILLIYCEELRIPKENLNKEQIEVLETINSKTIPIIEKEINLQKINNDTLLKERIHDIIQMQLENQNIYTKNTNQKRIAEPTVEKKELNTTNVINQIPEEIFFQEDGKDIDSTTKIIPSSIPETNYKAIEKLKNAYIVQTFDNTYFLMNKDGKKISSEFNDKIIDFVGNYLKVLKDDKYTIYKLNGEKLEDTDYLDITLEDDYYIVLTKDKNLDIKLDIHKYEDKDFKLSPTILVDRDNYKTDYKVVKENNIFKIKIKSNDKTYYVDNRTGLTQDEPSIDIDIIEEEKPILEKQLSEKTIEELKFETNKEELQQEIKEMKDEKVLLKDKEEKKLQKKEQETYKEINFSLIDSKAKAIVLDSQVEINKEELEDKEYEFLENKINQLLNEIDVQKRKKISQQDLNKLILEEQKLKNLKTKIQNQKEVDIESEKQLLKQDMTNKDLTKLELELEKLHFENQIDFNAYMLEQAEDLELMSKKQTFGIEKELLKRKLKKANKAMKITSLLALPFIKNKYFRYFTIGLFVHSHLSFFHQILKHKTKNYTKEDISIKKGQDAFEEALMLTSNNIEYLNELEVMALKKYPELQFDHEYFYQLQSLKNSLLKQEEKLLKKKEMLHKYHLKKQSYTRKLEKKKKVA